MKFLTEVEQSLENQPEMEGSFGKASTEKLSGDIERHLRRILICTECFAAGRRL